MADIAIIGGGNMGEALIKGVQGLRKHKVFVCESNPDRVRSLKKKYKITVVTIAEAVSASSVIILAVKPQDMAEVLEKINKNLSFPNASVGNPHKAISGPPTKTFGGDKLGIISKLIISIAAGLTTEFFEKKLGNKVRVIRAMPNMPALIGEGISGVCAGTYAKPEDLKLAKKILATLGQTVIVDESKMDALTAVSGSGPAYVFFFMECLVKAANALGLKSDLSKELVTATFLGSIHLLEKQKIEPGILRAKVTSKGGTTAAALDVFLKGKFNHLIYQALFAAKKRAKELST